MSSNSTPSKKTAAKKTTAASTAARKAAAKKTVAPRPRNGTAHPAPEPVAADAAAAAAAVDENTVIANFLANRRRRRKLLALKITCYVMAAGALTFIGLTIWQLTVSSPVADAYGTLAGVFVAATGVSCTVYHFMRRRKNNQDE
ncbi:hypothetical protein ABZ642_42180 [Streptomyces sp. NPDC007157]|uniref:hypothetical protein n=1 Tax=Streptomyces sp. NPDC007157 TaxID=3154681 RepID=UPI003406DCB7